ncbi:ABC transporter ATP-binding protein [Martelella soudanensis]|uniref:ABC transporter ATP-binding protein n=1 Tax=unclassified Martelella TaxID=2629616 RepID=UPI0015DFD9C3|nr:MULTISPECIES: sn-glycerol-3-phosphate ABC transporter ATP-binding protein UgpC [unclassified Martelella]
MGAIHLDNVRKSFGNVTVIEGIELEIADGEFVVFVGPSGCGKSTLLRLIAGLEEIDDGRISIDGEQVDMKEPADRHIAMVFQSYALYPHMSVRKNIGFGLRIAGFPKAEINAKIEEAARLLELTPLLERRPRDLSGGQRQRVAIGRAIVRSPSAFLFDEPLSNLDAALRVQMRMEIINLHTDLKRTMIYVTHDQVEAMTMADRIVVLNGGRVEQFDTPVELYDHPANLFVAGFIGSPKMNFLDVTQAEDNRLHLEGGLQVTLPDRSPAECARTKILGIRPEHFLHQGSGGLWDGKVTVAEQLGSDAYLHVAVAGLDKQLVVRGVGERAFGRGDVISLTPQAGNCHLFDAQGATIRNVQLPGAA